MRYIARKIELAVATSSVELSGAGGAGEGRGSFPRLVTYGELGREKAFVKLFYSRPR